VAGTGLSLRDDKILTLAYRGQSAEQIAAEVHAPVEVVIREIDRLTSSFDWLNDLQRYKLTFHGLQSLLGKLKDRAESGQDAQQTKNYLDAIRLVFEQLAQQQAKVDADIERVENAQARVMLEIVEKSAYRALGRLEERFKEYGIDPEEVELEFRSALMSTAHEYDKQ
jgi:multidrug efflux pump subunit AcrB